MNRRKVRPVLMFLSCSLLFLFFALLDPFHKPELACAVTPFEAMCSFRPLREINAFVQQHAELRDLLGEELADKLRVYIQQQQSNSNSNSNNTPDNKQLLRQVFEKLMTPDAALLKSCLDRLIQRLKLEGYKASIPACDDEESKSQQQQQQHFHPSNGDGARNLDVPSLVLRLSEQYPGDVGIFAPFYLNCFVLSPGQAIFLGPNEPHAYLSGECMECMACSDNVVRAGLTPKLRDTQVLIDMLTYEGREMKQAIMTPKHLDAHTTIYAPPKIFKEFQLVRTRLPAGGKAKLPSFRSAALLITFEGEGNIEIDKGTSRQQLRRGNIVLVPEGAHATLHANEDSKEGLLIFACATNSASDDGPA